MHCASMVKKVCDGEKLLLIADELQVRLELEADSVQLGLTHASTTGNFCLVTSAFQNLHSTKLLIELNSTS